MKTTHIDYAVVVVAVDDIVADVRVFVDVALTVTLVYIFIHI